MTISVDSLFSALGDPTRRAVIERLAEGPASVSELHTAHDIALPTFLRHLKVLERSGLVRSEKLGRVRVVHIEAASLVQIDDWMAEQRRRLGESVDRLSALAERIEGRRT